MGANRQQLFLLSLLVLLKDHEQSRALAAEIYTGKFQA